MTKAESFIYNSEKWIEATALSYTLPKGSYINERVKVRVYISVGIMDSYELHCNSHMGSAILYKAGILQGDIESRYDEVLKDLV